jgi:hypothetical protein
MPSILFKIKRRLVSAWLQVGSFNFWQKYGYHVMRVHYYSAIPDTSKLCLRIGGSAPEEGRATGIAEKVH